MKQARQRFLLILEVLPDHSPAAIRLRGALKVLLRRFGFRCLRVEELPPTEEEHDRRPAGPPPGE